MAAKGDQYQAPYIPSPYVYTAYAGLSVQDANRNGYATLLGHTAQSNAADAQAQALDNSLTDAERQKAVEDLIGDPSSPRQSVKVGPNVFSYPTVGCQYAAEKQLYGDVKAWNQAWLTVSQASAMTSDDVLHEQPVQAAAKRWSQCMASANRIYSTPNDAIDAGQSMSSDSGGKYVGPTVAEKRLAVADARCRASVGYDTAVGAATDAALGQYAEQNEGEVLKLIEIDRHAQKTAQALLK